MTNQFLTGPTLARLERAAKVMNLAARAEGGARVFKEYPAQARAIPWTQLEAEARGAAGQLRALVELAIEAIAEAEARCDKDLGDFDESEIVGYLTRACARIAGGPLTVAIPGRGGRNVLLEPGEDTTPGERALMVANSELAGEMARLARRYDIQRDALRSVLIQAVDESGYALSGPADPRAAEDGEPPWVCNARGVIADTQGAA